MAEIAIKGLSELQALLNTLPAKVEANILRGALRAGMKPILEDARANVAVDTGQLRDGLKISTKKKGGMVLASLSAKGKHGYLANWIEFGTAGHAIPGNVQIDGQWYTSVMHPGARAKPFLRPALDGRAQDAVVAAGEYIKQRLATKHGLDTQGITIGADDEE